MSKFQCRGYETYEESLGRREGESVFSDGGRHYT